MRPLLNLCALACLLAAALPVHAARHRDVEVCFALDTTGSMSGLIEAAKQKVWSIASALAQAPSKPRLRFCLMAYRDRGDDYVTRLSPLTDDLDALYAQLMELQAGGGGDTPEAVNQALLETLESAGYSASPDVLKILFLVGDAPPSVYADEPQYPEIAARARAAGVLINPVVCGSAQDTRARFEDIARLGGGRSAHLPEAGRVERISTPMDQDLAALNQRLGHLLIPYGDAATQQAVLDKQRRAERMSDEGLSDRLAFNHATGRVVQGGGDLIEALDTGAVQLDALTAEQLPESLRSMDEAELRAHVEAIRSERLQLRAVIEPLIELRQQHIEAQRRQGEDSFDAAVRAILQAQLGEG